MPGGRPKGSKDQGKRRGRREGSLEARGPGRWRMRIYVGTDPVTGHPLQRSKTVHARTKTDALAELRRWTQEIGEGRYGTSRAAMNRLFDDWLADLERVKKAPSTIATYRVVIAKHLRPAFGRTEVAEVRPAEINAYYRSKAAEGLSDGTIRQHGAILSAALSQAVKLEWIRSNPCQGATLPAKTATSRTSPGVDGVRKLIEAAADDIDLATAVVLGALTGCRRGELCGLQWHDLDRATGTLLVERARIPLVGGDKTGPPKGKKPRRVAIGPLGLAVLDRYSDALDVRAATIPLARSLGRNGPPGPYGDRGGWLISQDGGHTPIKAKWLSDQITALGKRAGVPVVTHELRHFAATEMVAAGVDVTTAATRLGHAPEMLLRTYAHAVPSRDVAAAAMLEAGVLGLPAALAAGATTIIEEPGSFS